MTRGAAPVPAGARPTRLGRRGLGLLSGGGVGLVGLCVVGFWVMSALQGRADRALALACDRTDFPATVHWAHGYGAALPVGSLIAALLGVIVSIVVIVARAAAGWSRLLSGLTLVVGCLVLLPAAIVAHDFYAYPGGDISTLHSSPCGSG